MTADSSMALFAAKGGGSAIIEAQLDIIGVAYERRYLAWDELHDADGELARINPMREVPTLVLPDGSVLTESAAITLWLGAKYPESGLVPSTDTAEYAPFLRTLIWLVASVYPTFSYGDHPERWLGDMPEAKALRTATDEKRKVMWRQLEARLDPAPWAMGERLTAIDLYLTIMSHWRPRRDWFRDNCPKIYAIAKRLDDMPALAPMWARNL